MASNRMDVPLSTLTIIFALAIMASVIPALSSVGMLLPIFGLLILLLFPAYASFNIRRALVVRLYRDQALGIGLVAIGLVLLIVSEFFIAIEQPPNSPGPFGTPIDLPFFYFAWLVLFYWIDSSIRASRRSDPLLRDTFYWKQVRIVVWAVNLVSIGLTSLYTLYLVVATGASLIVSPTPPPMLNLVSQIPIYVPILFGAIYLPAVAFRSRDPTLKRHLRWFGIFVVAFLAASLSLGTGFLAQTPAPTLLYCFSAYCLYLSAKYLVPLNKMSLVDLTSPLGNETSLKPITSLGHLFLN
jgi:hypothetical protein